MSAVKVNGIKKITDLTAATTINDADVFMIETTAGSRKVTGATLKTLINNAANAVGDDVDALQSVIAPEFDSTLDYSAGDYVYSEGKLYRFTADHVNGALDGSDTVEVTVTGDMVNDVTINGTSIVSDGVANVPVADYNNLGVVKPSMDTGIGIATSGANLGRLAINTTTANELKVGTNLYHPVTPSNANAAAFYGLAKASGDTTQSASSNTVGTYTDSAKASIKQMLGITDSTQTVTVPGTEPVITAVANTRYLCGEVTSITITPPASGICEVVFTSGSTVAVLSATGVTFPEWFDSTSLETNTTYELSIADGRGAVATW